MKQILAFFTIVIGALITIIGATMINQWLGVLTCGFWWVILGLILELQELLNRK